MAKKDKKPTYTYKLKGKIAIRMPGDNDQVKDHEEVVKATDEEEAVELSLTGFKPEEEPVWEQGFTVERVFHFTFEAYEIVLGRPCAMDIKPFVGTFAEMEAYIAKETEGAVLHEDAFTYTQNEP